MKRVNARWERLAGAALVARDELRAVLPRLDQAITAGADVALLEDLRRLAARHAESLKAALKAPERSRRASRNDAAWRNGPLWGSVGAPKAPRYQEVRRRNLGPPEVPPAA